MWRDFVNAQNSAPPKTCSARAAKYEFPSRCISRVLRANLPPLPSGNSPASAPSEVLWWWILWVWGDEGEGSGVRISPSIPLKSHGGILEATVWIGVSGWVSVSFRGFEKTFNFGDRERREIYCTHAAVEHNTSFNVWSKSVVIIPILKHLHIRTRCIEHLAHLEFQVCEGKEKRTIGTNLNTPRRR